MPFSDTQAIVAPRSDRPSCCRGPAINAVALQLIINRLALGIAEGSVLTCVIVLIRAWFTRAERARANTMFLLSLAAGPMIADPISGAILSISDWRWMFVIEAIPGLLWRVVWWPSIEDNPKDAAWMDPDKRASLVAALEAERREMAPLKGHWLRTLWHPAVLLLALYNFLALMAEWGVNFWLPSVLKDTGLPIGMVGLLAAIPYVLGISVPTAWESGNGTWSWRGRRSACSWSSCRPAATVRSPPSASCPCRSKWGPTSTIIQWDAHGS